MIELGLARISRLVPASSLAWKAIHIAGTNGKGSIAGYLSSLLTAGGLRCGSFTSPHLVDRWDCITINERAVQESLFRHVEEQVKQRDASLGVGATEFELLTATAFEIFRQEQVDVGVVEVGMGGRLDSTNILPSESVLVSVIANIGLDHQAILGSTLAEIAAEKAGIMKPGVPCVVDGTNEEQVKGVMREHASRANTTVTFVEPDSIMAAHPQLRQRFHDLAAQPHQRSNISCAVAALEHALPRLRANLKPTDLLPFLPLSPRAARSITSTSTTTQFGHDISEALQWAHLIAADNPIVIAGSLYLVSDVLRLLRQATAAEEDTAADTAVARTAAYV
ncbi:folylpolyglutamate synthase [Nannizzia gypsea CBS 118893]|uniref:Folylpolyglutamate synthase n=1 Tax=Arthroderma gypseum (strain ATCC MYA-4604 / CBS 118893) TaxID=535722 RepID=E5R3Z6_ARTGP|nr:folylpolyglutamate synthase [Nannizzia gypsea CBS 118893]EFQ98842.1 folylpolyglutamate synthase [Nannizzia gypsea CBS 118893]